MKMKRKNYASVVLVSVALSLAVYVEVTSYSQEELFDNSLATENIEALSNSEDNKYSVDNEVIAYRSGKCYVCKVQYTYKKDGKTYAHYNNK